MTDLNKLKEKSDPLKILQKIRADEYYQAPLPRTAFIALDSDEYSLLIELMDKEIKRLSKDCETSTQRFLLTRRKNLRKHLAEKAATIMQED